MVRCPNCGRKTYSGDYCQWCGHPVLRHSLRRGREVEKKAKKEAEQQAKEKVKAEAKEAKKAKEAEARAKKEAEEAEKKAKKEAEQQAKEKAKAEAEEAKKAKEVEARAKKEAEEAEKKTKEEAKEVHKVVQDIYEGNFELVVPSPVSFEQVKQFAERLRQVENLKVVWLGGSVDEGAIIGVSVQKPMTLIQVLNEMPAIEKVDKKGEKIIAMLKTTT